MKKALMILASVALGASMATAATNVVSKNIVGFGTINVPAGAFRLIGCNFQDLTNGNSISIQNLFNTNDLYADQDGDSAKSDQIYVYNGSTYDIYSYLPDEINGGNKWFKGGIATTVFSRGDAFWYKRGIDSSATTLTVAGQAPLDASWAHTLPTGFSLFSYAFPNATAFTNLAMSAYGDADGDSAKSDQIYVYNGSTYDIYSYLPDEINGGTNWFKGGLATYGLPVGVSAWYKRAVEAGGNQSWTETKPY